MTIDVAKLRSLARYQNDAVITAEEITELLDAYEELHRYDADMEAGGDWLPLHLREAVAGIDPEQRAVVTEWYWRTNLLIGGLQTERDRLRAALEFYADPDTYKATPSGSQNSWGNYEVIDYPIGDDEGEIARAALEGRE